MGKEAQEWAQWVFAPLCRCLANIVTEARYFQKSGYNQGQHVLWKRVTSVNPLQHCRSSSYAGYHTNILWSSARTCLCLTIQLYSLCHSQQQEMYTTYQGSCIQNKLVTIDINYHKSGASIGVVYICTLLLLRAKQCHLKNSFRIYYCGINHYCG